MALAARLTSCGTACTSKPSPVRCVAARAVPAARFGGGRGGNVLDRPDVDIKRQGWDTDKDLAGGGGGPQLDTERNGGAPGRQRGAPPGGGNYRVLLLDSPKHTEQQVIKAITLVVPGADDTHARNCFNTSKQLGMALVISCLKEHAEHYRMQLYQRGCSTSIEPDNTTA